MSYILDAIKRSERQRLNSGMAALRAVPAFAEAARQPPLLLYGAAAAALIAAGVGIGWLRPWQPAHAAMPTASARFAPPPRATMPHYDADTAQAEPPPLTAPPAPEKAEVLHVMRVRPYRAAAPTHAGGQAATPRAPATAPAIAPNVAPATSSATPVAAAIPSRATEAVRGGQDRGNAAPAPVASRAAASVPAGGTSAGQLTGAARVFALYELPPDIAHDIPPMAISGFTYSDTPEGRMVDINDRLLQEGQYVSDGLKLEQITPDGLIFSYRNYRFRQNVH